MLDNNVWRYLLDQKAEQALLEAAPRSRIHIIVAPSVAYESLRSPDDALRAGLLKLITHERWVRLMPEAYSESRELLLAIKAHRPEWLRERADRSYAIRLKKDWTTSPTGFWVRARCRPHEERKHLRTLGSDETLNTARAQAQERRDAFRNDAWNESTPLDTVFASFHTKIAGWNGDSIDAWRVTACESTGDALQAAGHPYAEWMGGEIDIARIFTPDRASWRRFWFYDARRDQLPRFWLRWAFEFYQSFRKITDGTPADAQLATYLFEADYVVSADKGFIAVTDKIRPYTSKAMAKTLLVKGGEEGVHTLLAFLKALSVSRREASAS